MFFSSHKDDIVKNNAHHDVRMMTFDIAILIKNKSNKNMITIRNLRKGSTRINGENIRKVKISVLPYKS